MAAKRPPVFPLPTLWQAAVDPAGVDTSGCAVLAENPLRTSHGGPLR